MAVAGTQSAAAAGRAGATIPGGPRERAASHLERQIRTARALDAARGAAFPVVVGATAAAAFLSPLVVAGVALAGLGSILVARKYTAPQRLRAMGDELLDMKYSGSITEDRFQDLSRALNRMES